MSTALTIYANTGTADSSYDTSSAIFTEVDTANDYLVFSAGSVTVADAASIPSATDLIQAGTLITTTSQNVAHYFLADVSAGTLKEIHNAGNNNKRYVFCFSFDGATASEPVLEVWDDTTMDTSSNTSLGAGTASSSWFRGITTTDALPGADWTGSYLAGSSSSHFLWLNNGNGALGAAGELYCNLKIVVPGYVSGSEPSGLDSNVIVIKYASN